MGENLYFPFAGLGSRLRKCRELIHESMAEVSGAVEIDIETLSKIEQGIMQPSEEILLLLISHFGIDEDDAVNLWELAGYDKRPEAGDSEQIARQLLMLVPVDNRVLFTDNVKVTSNKHGVTVSFLQTATDGRPAPISRVGMSREQVRELIDQLRLALETLAPAQKFLPASKTQKTTTDESKKN